MGNTIFIVGAGAVGMSLGKALMNRGMKLTGIFDLDTRIAADAATRIGAPGFGGAIPATIREADTVLITVPDHAVSTVVDLSVAEGLYDKKQVWIHCSGHLTTRVFEPVAPRVSGVGAMHPAWVFPPGCCTPLPEGVHFAVDGARAGLVRVEELVTRLGGKTVHVPPDKRPLYHCAMVMASNYVVTLLNTAASILEAAQVSNEEGEAALFQLCESALGRARQLGIHHSLSGPVRRGDVGVVKDHLDALADLPDLQDVYTELGKATVRLAAEQPGYCPDTARTLMELLSAYQN